MELVVSEAAFEQAYRPVLDSGGAWREYWTDDPLSANLLEEAMAERRVWTMLDVDGFTMLASGWHVVNRLGYYISRVAVPVGTDVLVYDEEEWLDWQRRLFTAESRP